MNRIKSFLEEPITFYTLIIALSISGFILMEALYPTFLGWASSMHIGWFETHYPIFVTGDDRKFSEGFVEWFGVFYGFLLPMLLVRAWEQLDSADREFDREADSIKVLHEDFLLLDDEHFLEFKIKMITQLYLYARHILSAYSTEHQDGEKNVRLKKRGNAKLQKIRTSYKNLIYRGGGEQASQLEPVTAELLSRLNDTIDIRGDRISIFKQRLYESLKMIAIITSILWLTPFYFMTFKVGVFGSLLKLGVTFLVIFVLTVIHDLDEPFSGLWTVSTTAWEEIRDETRASFYELLSVKRKIKEKLREFDLPFED